MSYYNQLSSGVQVSPYSNWCRNKFYTEVIWLIYVDYILSHGDSSYLLDSTLTPSIFGFCILTICWNRCHSFWSVQPVAKTLFIVRELVPSICRSLNLLFWAIHVSQIVLYYSAYKCIIKFMLAYSNAGWVKEKTK